MSESVSLPSIFQQYIHTSRYARWLPESNRRETWVETVDRYFSFFDDHLTKFDYSIPRKLRGELRDAVLNLEIMPSMRCIMTAGPALQRDNAAAYNCCFLGIDRPQSFDEAMYLLMCGCGVGFSVESKFVNKLPVIQDEFHNTETIIMVADSKIGWAKAYRELLAMLYIGQVPTWDLTKLRPAGAPLKTFGGRSSGPEPLERLFKQTVHLFRNAKGRKLTTLECHDLMCMIADVIVVGGTRRSALISLSDIHDSQMRFAKSGEWYKEDQSPWRRLSNNSYVIDEQPMTLDVFIDEWKALYLSKSGERGIFSRAAARKQAEKFGRRNPDYDFGCNPCSEIFLRNRGFCNLSEVVVRSTDTEESLSRKVRLASILGTFQSTLTNFRYLSAEWKRNAEEERLLGVSLTGIFDNPLMWQNTSELAPRLERLRDIAVTTNAEFATKLKINQAAAVTCVKPSGTVSSLVDSASGIHPRHSQYYTRRVINAKTDPLTQLMIDQKFVIEDSVYKKTDASISFPMKAPDGSMLRDDLTAISHLELWLAYQRHWAEHKPSCTVSVRESEWMDVGAWVWKHLDELSGVSFLPMSDHVYEQSPYENCTEAKYNELVNKQPVNVDWSQLTKYETEDTTTGTQQLACVSGVCEI